jgi:hypothetical protein
MHSNTHAKKREQQHAKLFTYRGQQVLVYLFRDENDALTTVMQLWVASTDEQLRISVNHPSLDDNVIGLLFEDLDEEAVAHTLDHLGVPGVLAGASTDG